MTFHGRGGQCQHDNEEGNSDVGLHLESSLLVGCSGLCTSLEVEFMMVGLVSVNSRPLFSSPN